MHLADAGTMQGADRDLHPPVVGARVPEEADPVVYATMPVSC